MDSIVSLLSVFSSYYSAWPLPVVAVSAVLVLLLWVLFMSVMVIAKRYAAEKRPLARLLLLGIGIPTLVLGLIVDVVVNATVAWGVFGTPPAEWTLTERLRKLIEGPRGKDRDRAIWFCTHFIEPWDWNHCGLAKLGVK
jgi:hypothetical protein